MSKLAFRVKRGAIHDDLFSIEVVDIWGSVVSEYGDVEIGPGGVFVIGRESFFRRQQIAQENESKV